MISIRTHSRHASPPAGVTMLSQPKSIGARLPVICVALVSVLFVQKLSFAHHSYAAEFDRNSPATIEGVVREVWFKNPHVRYYVDVTDLDGNVTTWDTRGLSPVKLVRAGWTRDTIKVGDRITLHGHIGLTNKTIMSILDITLADGRVLTSRSVAYDVKN